MINVVYSIMVHLRISNTAAGIIGWYAFCIGSVIFARVLGYI